MTQPYSPVHITPFRWIDPRTIPPRARALASDISNGFKAADGLFDHDDDGPLWLEFEQWLADGSLENVFWCPTSDEVATFRGLAFALGAEAIDNPATYALGGYLHIHATVGRWIQARGKGIFIVDWRQAFDRLRDAPRISGDPEIVATYHRHMRPARMPEFIVLRDTL